MNDIVKNKIINSSTVFSSQDINDHPSFAYLFDLRELLTDPIPAAAAGARAWEMMKEYEPTVLFTTGVAGTLFAAHIQTAASKDGKTLKLLIIRDERKKNNRKRFVEGGWPEQGERAFFIDDLANTLSTFKRAKNGLAQDNINLEILGICVVIDFWTHQTRALEVNGLKVVRLYRRHELGITRTDVKKSLIEDVTKPYTRLLITNDPSGHEITSPVIIDNNNLYVATNDHCVRKINLIDKTIEWEDIAPMPKWFYEPKGIINLMAHDEQYLYYTSYHGYLTKLNKESGKVEWRIIADRWIHASPIIDKETNSVYTSSEYRNEDKAPQGDIISVDCDTGKIKWRFKTNELAPCSPIFDETSVYSSSNNGFAYSINKITGELLWSYDMKHPAKGRAGIINDKVIFCTEKGIAYSFERATGKLVSCKYVSNGLRHVFVMPCNDKFVIIDSEGFVKCFDENLVLCWISRIRGKGYWYPEIYGDSVYFLTSCGYFAELDINTGEKKSYTHFDTEAGCPPSISEKYIVLNFSKKGLFVYEQ